MKTIIGTFTNDFAVVKLTKLTHSKAYFVTIINLVLHCSHCEYYADKLSAYSRFKEVVSIFIS